MGYRLSDEAMAALRAVPEASTRLRAVAQRLVGPRPSVVHDLQSAADAVASAADGGTQQRRAGQPLPVQIVEPTIDVKQIRVAWLAKPVRPRQPDAARDVPVVLHALVRRSVPSQGREARRIRALSDRRVTVEVLNEVGDQISRFLMHQALTGVIVGVATWLAVWWLGLDTRRSGASPPAC